MALKEGFFDWVCMRNKFVWCVNRLQGIQSRDRTPTSSTSQSLRVLLSSSTSWAGVCCQAASLSSELYLRERRKKIQEIDVPVFARWMTRTLPRRLVACCHKDNSTTPQRDPWGRVSFHSKYTYITCWYYGKCKVCSRLISSPLRVVIGESREHLNE